MAKVFVATSGPPGVALGRFSPQAGTSWAEEKMDGSGSIPYEMGAPTGSPGSKLVRLTNAASATEVFIAAETALVFVGGQFAAEYCGRWEIGGVPEPPPPEPARKPAAASQSSFQKAAAANAAAAAADTGLPVMQRPVGGGPQKKPGLDTSPSMVEQLYAAAATGDVAKVKSLLETVDPDVKSKAGATPLFAAAQKGSLPCVQALIQAGANPNIDKDGKTPMQVAFASGKKDIVGALLGATCSSLENIVGAGVGGMADNIDTHGYVPNRDADEVPYGAVDELKEVTARLAALGQSQPLRPPDASMTAMELPTENQDSEVMREEAVRDAMRLIVNTSKQ